MKIPANFWIDKDIPINLRGCRRGFRDQKFILEKLSSENHEIL